MVTPLQEERVSEPDRTRAELKGPAAFRIHIGTGEPNFELSTIGSQLTAQIDIDVTPGTGTSTFCRLQSTSTDTVGGVCASTAHLLLVQTVLELCLIFYGVRLYLPEKACQHDDGKVCALKWSPKQIVKMEFRKRRRDLPPLPTSQNSETMENACERSDCGDIQAEDMTSSLWDFVKPVEHTACDLYIQLKANPIPRPNLPRSTLVSLCRRIRTLQDTKGDVENTSKPRAIADADSIIGMRSKLPNQQSGMAKKRKRTVSSSQQSIADETTFADHQGNEHPTFKPWKVDFKAQLTDASAKHDSTHCAVLRDQGLLEGAHIVPKCMSAALMGPILLAVFETNTDEADIIHKRNLQRCIPLFCRDHYTFPPCWPSMDDSAHNGLLLGHSVHKLMDSRFNIFILRQVLTVVGRLQSHTELLFFHPPCPTAQIHSSDVKDITTDSIVAAQIQHETNVQPFDCVAPEKKWATLHVRSAASFYCLFMEGKMGTLNLLDSMADSTKAIHHQTATDDLQTGPNGDQPSRSLRSDRQQPQSRPTAGQGRDADEEQSSDDSSMSSDEMERRALVSDSDGDDDPVWRRKRDTAEHTEVGSFLQDFDRMLEQLDDEEKALEDRRIIQRTLVVLQALCLLGASACPTI
ncbi:hypothetical protein CF319_g6882 [Tilletia indica]|nr:hypothetical protein CF319_g6882 [Tilletia indica]